MLAHRTRWGWLQSDPGLLFGVLCTVTYYVVICQHMFAETWLAKYTTEHEVEYVIVTLFFWGVCDMLAKLSRLPREQRAMNYD